jgi:hypothetical protein
MQQDDATMGVIACHTSPDHCFWYSWRLPGNPFYRDRWPTIGDAIVACPDGNVWPVQKMVLAHMHDTQVAREALRKVRNAPPDVAYACRRNEWTYCQSDAAKIAAITGCEELRRWTPVVKFRKGRQQIMWDAKNMWGPKECKQCTKIRTSVRQNEQEKIALWNWSGWSEFHGTG